MQFLNWRRERERGEGVKITVTSRLLSAAVAVAERTFLSFIK